MCYSHYYARAELPIIPVSLGVDRGALSITFPLAVSYCLSHRLHCPCRTMGITVISKRSGFWEYTDGGKAKRPKLVSARKHSPPLTPGNPIVQERELRLHGFQGFAGISGHWPGCLLDQVWLDVISNIPSRYSYYAPSSAIHPRRVDVDGQNNLTRST